MQLASTSTPRSATSSVTCSYDSGYRRYQRTHKTITSPGYWRPLNGLCGLIGMDFYPIRLPAPKFATEPRVPPAEAIHRGYTGLANGRRGEPEQVVGHCDTGAGDTVDAVETLGK